LNKKTAGNWALAFFSCLLIVTCPLPLLQLGVSYAYQSSSMTMIDLYTQKEPYGGKGPNQTSDAFGPQEEVILYANVTYKGEPAQSTIVAFEVHGPTNSVENFTLIRTALTNASGVAMISFRMPWPCENAETIIFGTWTAIAKVKVVEETVEDTLTFRVGWIVEIVSIWTINEKLQPQTRFARGTCVGVEMVLRNIAMTPKNASFTLVVYDSESQPIANTALEDVEVKPGETSISVLCKLLIPKWALYGYATVYANAYTALPQLGGVAYCPEVSAGILITLCDVAVVGVTPSLTKIYAGGVVNITVTVRNEGRETETFNVTAYADKNVTVIGDEIIIGTQTVTNLPPPPSPDNQKNLTFTWNTTGATPGIYTISAQASVVPAEIDTSDNTYIDGTVKIIKRPVAYFTYSPEIPIVNETVTFDATLSTPDGGTIVSYVWDFGDGTPVVNETDPITTHIYTTAGTYNVTLTITNDDGLNDTTTHALTVYLRHDVAVISVDPSPTEVYAGEEVTITVVAKNEGMATETFNVTAYYNGNIIGTQKVVLAPGGNKTLTFSWDTSGVPVGEYVIKAEASVVPGETNIEDNTYIDGTVTVKPIHDVAVVGVTPSITQVYVGQVVDITVTVRNEGTAIESFDVSLYYDGTVIGTQTVTGLGPGAEKTLKFSWNTTGVKPGVSYVIKAVASTLPGETDIADNTYVDGTVTVKSPPVHVSPRGLVLLGIIVAAVIALTILVALLYRRRRRKSGLLAQAHWALAWH
jgi:PKD repeat protein